MINALFGKTMERPENHCRVVLTSDKRKHQKLVGSPCFKQSRIINENLVSVKMGYPAVKVRKPFYIGLCILELAKNHMYHYHYNIMKEIFDNSVRVLYTDTDSFFYEITGPDAEEKMDKNPQHFDFSNYPPDHHLFSTSNKRVPGLFKDEVAGSKIREFVGLRSKMYSFIFSPDGEHKVDSHIEENKTAKGVSRSVIRRELNHSDYRSTLFHEELLQHNYSHIISKSHNVVTARRSKISLSPFDDKRFLLNTVESLPYGHFRLENFTPKNA